VELQKLHSDFYTVPPQAIIPYFLNSLPQQQLEHETCSSIVEEEEEEEEEV
jgi:hypothetical protein